MDAFVGIDVAFAKRKRLPVCVCVREEERIALLALATVAALSPPVGSTRSKDFSVAITSSLCRDE